jgi:hypothetical protein
MMLERNPQENTSNLLDKTKEDLILVLEDSLNMKLKLISILSQNFKPSLEMEQVLSSKPGLTTEHLVLVKLISMNP